MASRPRESASLPALLALMCGGGLLFAFYKFSGIFQELAPPERLIMMLLAGAITVWGGWNLFAREADHGTGRIAWWGLVLVMLGLELMYTVVRLTIIPAVAIVVGCLGAGLALWGAKEIVSFARPRSSRRTRPRERRALPLPGLVYLAMMAVFFVGSLLGRSNMLMLIFAFMAGPFVMNGWWTFRMLRGIAVSRNLPATAAAGERVGVEIVFQNRKRWFASWVMNVRDGIDGPGESLSAEVLFPRIPPSDERSARYFLRPMRRGRYRFGPLIATTRFPLGIVERGLEFPVDGELIVFPRIGRVAPRWKKELLTASELVHQRQSARGVYDDEFHSLREYRGGDNPRAIHWRTSARMNELMVREYHQDRDVDLAVYLDFWQPPDCGEADIERVELAASFAATICVEHMRQSRDARVELTIAGRAYTQWQGHAGVLGFDSLLRSLAVAEAAPSADADKLLQLAIETRSPARRTLLVTTRRIDNARLLGGAKSRTELAAGELPADLQVVEASEQGLDGLLLLEEPASLAAPPSAESDPSGDATGVD